MDACTNDRDKLAKGIFLSAVEIASPHDRVAYLERRCGEESALRAEIESLLRHHDLLGGTPDTPVDAPGMTPGPGPRTAPEGPGTVVGPYKLLEPIGEGGMGTVFMAEQTRPVRRRVALKVIKPGMDTKQVIARFEAERQALALMDHPNIAKVHDAGATDSGRPYFVMELVKGIPITEYCDREERSIPERLELFVLVCRAVQHAHQKGIIHRDLKPSNILVTVIDGAAVPKVIDFGVAKATGGQLTEETLFTGFAQMIGTPLYMSPEQAQLSGVDVDTRSDVYALGVLLYELLTGTTPIERETFSKAAYDEIRRVIREQEPPTPSTRLGTLGVTLSAVSANRQCDARKLGRTVRGELDWIVMKALEKDRNRRYETASDFAADVMRHLTDRPVEACPPSGWYRVRKYGRRNRKVLGTAAVLVAAGLIVVSSLGVFYLKTVHRLRQLDQDVKQSLAGARTAIEASDLTLASLRAAEAQARVGADRGALPELSATVEGIRREIEARQTDEDRFRRFVKLASDAHDKMSFARDLGGDRAAEQVLGLYGILANDDWLSRLETSHLTGDQKQQVRETAFITLISLADFMVRWPETRDDPGSVARSQDLLRRAQAFHEPTRAFYFVRSQCLRKLGDTAAADEAARQFRAAPARTAWDYFLPGHTAGWGGDLDEAIRSYQAALALQPDHYNSLFFLAERLGTDGINRRPEAIAYFTGCIALRPDHIWAYTNRAECHEKLGQPDAAEADYTAALAVVTDAADRAFLLQRRGEFRHRMGRADEDREDLARTIESYEKALEGAKSTLGLDSPRTLMIMNNLGTAYGRAGRVQEEVMLLEQALEKCQAAFGPDHENTLKTMNNLGAAYGHAGRVPEAITVLGEVLEKNRRILGPDHVDTLTNMNNLGGIYLDAGRAQDAVTLFEPALEKYKSTLGPDHKDTLRAVRNLGMAYAVAGRAREAVTLLEPSLEKHEATLGPNHPDTFIGMGILAYSYEAAGKFDQAETVLQDQLKQQRKQEGPKSEDIARVLASLGLNLLKQGKSAEAEPILRECLAIREQAQPDVWSTFNTQSMLGGALLGQKKYAEAEPLVMRGYEEMERREATIPPIAKDRLTEAAERIGLFYEVTGQAEKARRWRERHPTSEASKAGKP